MNTDAHGKLYFASPGDKVPRPLDDFRYGAVEFKDWQRLPFTNKISAGVIGDVRIVSSQEAVGFEINGGGHTNWIALVRGPSGVVVAVPGCQVNSVTYLGATSVIANGEFTTVP